MWLTLNPTAHASVSAFSNSCMVSAGRGSEAKIHQWFSHFLAASDRFPYGAGSLANYALSHRLEVDLAQFLLQLTDSALPKASAAAQPDPAVGPSADLAM